MPTDRELMQQALDALQNCANDEDDVLLTRDTLAALRARLAQPEPEPVAWFMEGTFKDGTPSFTQVCETDPEFYVPLYTAPPQREWQELTDEEILKIPFGEHDIDYARAIEQAVKEKNA